MSEDFYYLMTTHDFDFFRHSMAFLLDRFEGLSLAASCWHRSKPMALDWLGWV